MVLYKGKDTCTSSSKTCRTKGSTSLSERSKENNVSRNSSSVIHWLMGGNEFEELLGGSLNLASFLEGEWSNGCKGSESLWWRSELKEGKQSVLCDFSAASETSSPLTSAMLFEVYEITVLSAFMMLPNIWIIFCWNLRGTFNLSISSPGKANCMSLIPWGLFCRSSDLA